MVKVVLDTNIFVSSIFWENGNSHKIIELALEKKIEVYTSIEILEELRKILKRDFDEPDEIIERQLNLILSYAHIVKPNIEVDIVKEDKEDNKIIECAISSDAGYIVTGDKHLLKLVKYAKIGILTPKQFLEII